MDGKPDDNRRWKSGVGTASYWTDKMPEHTIGSYADFHSSESAGSDGRGSGVRRRGFARMIPGRCTRRFSNASRRRSSRRRSSHVTLRGVKAVSHGPNNGCDPESSRDVLIEGCTFVTGDDCIAIKSGRNANGRRLHAPSENITVENCVMKDGHGGVTMGSECSGDIRNVFAQDCTMDSPNLDRVLRFKNNAMRGGVIEHVYMRNVKAGQVAGPAIEVDFYYEEGEKGSYTPVVRDVEVVNLTC